MDQFERSKHVVFFNRVLQILPTRYSSLDSNRLTIAFFALSALDILDALHTIDNPKRIIEWIYSLQVLPDSSGHNRNRCGFRGGSCNGIITEPGDTFTAHDVEHDYGHIAMTYTGLASLLILGDDLSHVDRKACLEHVRALQLDNGSFKTTIAEGGESDMRFVYCACCISVMLNDFSAVNQDAACAFIKSSLCYDGGFGQGPDEESHGGSTFCACAALQLMGRLNQVLSVDVIEKLQYWCLHRQNLGFHGRAHKDDDSCYSFWLGATLKILDSFELIDFERNKNFVLSTQDTVVGGFGKWPQVHPDALHSYMGMCGLSLMGDFDLLPINPALNITQRAVQHMKQIHKEWEKEKLSDDNTENEESVQNINKPEPPSAFNYKTVIIAIVVGLGPAFFPWCYKMIFNRGGSS